jgi:hypothetical protein
VGAQSYYAGATALRKRRTTAVAVPRMTELPPTISVNADPEARPVPITAYGTVRTIAPIAIAPAKARGRMLERPANRTRRG